MNHMTICELLFDLLTEGIELEIRRHMSGDILIYGRKFDKENKQIGVSRLIDYQNIKMSALSKDALLAKHLEKLFSDLKGES